MATASRLAEALSEQLTILRELQQALQEEQKAIANLDTPLMELLNSQKEQLVSRQRIQVETVRSAMSETAGSLGLPTSATLRELVEKMAPAMRTEVEPLQKAIKEAGSAVSMLANQNRSMLERFLLVVNDSLGFLLRILNTSNTYGARGTYLANAQSGAIMVNREA